MATFEKAVTNLIKKGGGSIASGVAGKLADVVLAEMFGDEVQEAIGGLSHKVGEMEEKLSTEMSEGFTVNLANTDEVAMKPHQRAINTYWEAFVNSKPNASYFGKFKNVESELFVPLEIAAGTIHDICVGAKTQSATPYFDLVVKDMFNLKNEKVLTLQQFVNKLTAHVAYYDAYLKKVGDIIAKSPEQEKLDAAKTKFEAAKAKLDVAKEDLDKLERSLEQADQALKVQSEKKAQSERQKAEKARRIGAASAEFEKAEAEHARRIDAAKDEVRQAEAEQDAALAEVNKAKDAAADVERRRDSIAGMRNDLTDKLHVLLGELDRLIDWIDKKPVVWANGILDLKPGKRSLADPDPYCLGGCGYRFSLGEFKVAYGESGSSTYVSTHNLVKALWSHHQWYVQSSPAPVTSSPAPETETPPPPAYLFRRIDPNGQLMCRLVQEHKYELPDLGQHYKADRTNIFDNKGYVTYYHVQFGTDVAEHADQSYNWQIIPSAIVSKIGRRGVIIANQVDGAYYPIHHSPQDNHKIEAPPFSFTGNPSPNFVWYFCSYNADGVLI